MALSKAEKATLLEKFGTKQSDTASPQVQIALLTERLNKLNEHFKVHKKDNHSRYGVLKLVGRRRRMLRYLKSTDMTEYKNLIKALGIRK